VLGIVDYIAADNPDAALRFVEAVRDAERELLDLPLMGVARDCRNSALSGMRMRGVPGFPAHLIFYRPIPEGIEVIRVLHGARELDAIFDKEV
jgi:toxin ParE1/3/4